MRILLLLLLPSLCFAKEVEYFNYKFNIPNNYSIHNNGKPLHPSSNAIHITKDGKGIAMIQLVDKEKKNFFSLKDYGAKSYRELFYVIFTDVPSDNEAVKELREFDDKYDLQKFEISERDNFVFFKSNNPMNLVGEVKILVSTPSNDEVINISLSSDDKLEKSILDSIEVK